MVKNTMELCKRFFLHKINKNMQRKPRVKCFMLRVDVINVKFKTLQLYNFVKTDQNATEFCTRLLLRKIMKSMS